MDAQVQLKSKQERHYAVKGDNFKADAYATVQDVDTSKRQVKVVLNTYNFVDSDMDVLLPGAAKRSIKNRGPESTAVAKIKAAKDHNLEKIPGKFIYLAEEDVNYKGHNITSIVGVVEMFNTTLGNDQLIEYQQGGIDNHSIGFKYTKIELVERNAHGNSAKWQSIHDTLINPKELDGKDFFFAVKEIDLYEGSSVAFGANSLTPYLGVKSGNKEGLLMKTMDRLSALDRLVKKGTETDEKKNTFLLQVMQLKQVVKELFDADPEQEKAEAIEPVIVSINYEEIAKNLVL